MRDPYPIAIMVDGRRCKGQWRLAQGGMICVGSPWGGDIADVGRDRPEIVAARILEQIVRADQKARAQELARQERELAKISRRVAPKRKKRPPAEAEGRRGIAGR